MTWNWTLTKFGIGLSLGFISSNPVGWAIGIPTSELIKIKGEENLNSSTLTLSDKENAQRLIEVATDYQYSLALGIVGKGVGSIAKGMASETAKIGKDAAKEIASNGGKFTKAARELISQGKNIAREEKLWSSIANSSGIIGVKEFIVSLADASLQELRDSTNQKEFIEKIKTVINLSFRNLKTIEEDFIENSEDLNNFRSFILELNKQNVDTYIRNGKMFNQHREINKNINELLKRVKKFQIIIHEIRKCRKDCRFC